MTEAYNEIDNLCKHAEKRGYTHPGILAFQDMVKDRPKDPQQLDIASEDMVDEKPQHPQHPDILAFQDMVRERRQDSHGEKVIAALMLYNCLDVTDARAVEKWQNDIRPMLQKMKMCEEELWVIIDDWDVKAFVAIEREMVRRLRGERLDVDEAIGDFRDWHVPH